MNLNLGLTPATESDWQKDRRSASDEAYLDALLDGGPAWAEAVWAAAFETCTPILVRAWAEMALAETTWAGDDTASMRAVVRYAIYEDRRAPLRGERLLTTVECLRDGAQHLTEAGLLVPLGADLYGLALATPLTLDAPDHLADVRTDTWTCTTCGAPMRDHWDEGREQCRSCWSRA